jgi:phage shock protein C
MKKLARSHLQRKLAGVCGGLAAYLDIDPTALRLAAVILTVVSGVVPGAVCYLAAALIMPEEPEIR